MYLLDSQIAMDMFSRDEDRSIFQWLNEDTRQIFVSVLSLGQISHTIDDMAPQKRNQWRRRYQEGKRILEAQGSLIDIDSAIVDVWQANLRGGRLVEIPDAAEELGEDDRLIIATAISRNYTFVTRESRLITEIVERTTLTSLFL
jgi:predicted nucleic acid-binding protein